MPIYAYRCASCGHALDALQKVSDPALTKCPQCGAEQLRKQVTAAGFQLKGSGWYVTDFRDGAKPAASGAKPAPAADAKDAKPDGAAQGADGKPAAKQAPAPAAEASAPAAAPGATTKSAA